MTYSDREHFKGTSRFAIRRWLGAGAFGTVYEAYDRERNTMVALKALREANADGIYRFKREFRALAGVAHPNLVTLYELISDGEQWFFTMELIEGCNFVDYVWGHDVSTPVDSTVETVKVSTIEVSSDSLIPASPARNGHFDLERLRDALRQLAGGINVLHEAGTLHRDIKPMNVLVTPEGRVVLLDFGLITELAPQQLNESLTLMGTPAYMSPEQGAGLPITEASDWYAVGVMLYEALTGKLPFAGQHLEVLRNKQTLEPVAPIELAPTTPQDLNALCMDLLRRDPEVRPSGREVLFRLGRVQVQMRPTLALPSQNFKAPFVGREKHLEELMGAFTATKTGRVVTMYLQGKSGMGKSALVYRFLDDLQRREKDVVVLASRCYEQESVPYKAVDSLVDALSKYLKHLPTSTVESLLPRDVLALARLFPVLRQVDAVAKARRRVHEISDSQELRRRAFSAFRELLARLADQKYLVLFIDDLQWGDADSVALLGELLRPPDPPALLLIASYRSEDVETSPPLHGLLQLRKTLTPGIESHELVVGELNPVEAQKLALTLLGEEHSISMNVEAIARESGASPFFIHELTRYLLAGRGKTKTAGEGNEQYGFRKVDDTTLGEVIWDRVSQLPKRARRLLEVVSVAGRPIPLDVAKLASKFEAVDQQALAILRSEHLIRIREAEDQDEIETYHDRIRETVITQLYPKTLRAYHYRLALSLESLGKTDLEAMAVHFREAGHPNEAAKYSIAAADKASEALAFDRASRLYHQALELRSAENTEQRTLLVKLASALANAGRPAESARFYLDAAHDADSASSLDFQRRAAEQLLMGGHIDEGLDVIRRVLAAVGLKLFSNPRRALLSLLMRRAQLRLRGLNFSERKASEIPASDLLRIDICWAVAAGLGSVDAIRGADFQTLHLLLALRAGEPYRVARAMAIEAGFSAIPGRRSAKRSAHLVRAAEVLAQKAHNPHATGLSTVMAGIASFLAGHWRKAADLCHRAETILRDQCIGAAWELASAQRFLLSSLMYLGELRKMAERLPDLISEAKERGNLYAATSLRSRMHIVWLAAGEPDRARRETVEALAEWSQTGFYLQHFYSLFALTQIELYSGMGHLAWKHIQEQWPALMSSMLLRIQVLRVESMHLKARCALAMATVDKDPGRLLSYAENLAKRISRERTGWSEPWSLLTRAGIAGVQGEQSLASDLLSRAAVDFDATDMGLYAAAARRRLGAIIGGDYGQELIAGADAWMLEQKIISPAFMTRMLAPGFAGDC